MEDGGSIPFCHLVDQPGASPDAMRSAVNGLVARGIVESLADVPPLLFVRLTRIFTRQSADERVAWQSGRPSPDSIALAAGSKATHAAAYGDCDVTP